MRAGSGRGRFLRASAHPPRSGTFYMLMHIKSPFYGNPHRRDRNSSAVPPFLAGLSGSLTQPILRSPDIAGSAPRLSRGTPRPVLSAYPGGFQHTVTRILLLCRDCPDVLFLFYVTFSGITRNLLCILPEFHRFVNRIFNFRLFAVVLTYIFLNGLVVHRHTASYYIFAFIVGAPDNVTD